jgi:hypothetical protein
LGGVGFDDRIQKVNEDDLKYLWVMHSRGKVDRLGALGAGFLRHRAPTKTGWLGKPSSDQMQRNTTVKIHFFLFERFYKEIPPDHLVMQVSPS